MVAMQGTRGQERGQKVGKWGNESIARGDDALSHFTFDVVRLKWLVYAIAFCMVVLVISETQADSVTALLEAGRYHEAAQLLQKLASTTVAGEGAEARNFFFRFGASATTSVCTYRKR